MKHKKMIIGLLIVAAIGYVMYRKGCFGKKSNSSDQSTTKDIAPLKMVQDFVPTELTGTEQTASAAGGGGSIGCRQVGISNPYQCSVRCKDAGGTFNGSADGGNGACAGYNRSFGSPILRRSRVAARF